MVFQVNNAGATLGTPWYTAEGVGGSAQVWQMFVRFPALIWSWSSWLGNLVIIYVG